MTALIHLQPTREPPPTRQVSRAGPPQPGRVVKPPPWQPPPNMRVPTKIQIKIQTQISENNTMKKDRKKQEDRLLKHLSLRERQRQVQLRQQIAQDLSFLVV